MRSEAGPPGVWRAAPLTTGPPPSHTGRPAVKPPRLPLCNPSDHRSEFTTEHQAVVCLCPVLRRLLSLGGGQIVLARPEGVPDKHCMFAGPPGLQPFLYPASDRMRWRDVAGSLYDHHLEDDEPLRVPPTVSHPLQLGAEHPDEPAADLHTRGVIAPRWYKRKVILTSNIMYMYRGSIQVFIVRN